MWLLAYSVLLAVYDGSHCNQHGNGPVKYVIISAVHLEFGNEVVIELTGYWRSPSLNLDWAAVAKTER